ncbi:hypothetical protein MRX96_025446 [Rhipicephalus microplus]
MASVQRDHWSFVVLQFLLLSLLICRHGAFADRNKYFHISSLCMGERHYPQYKKIDGAVLTSESENNLECAVTFQTDSILQRFMLRFERLALDCHDHLVIFDGAHAIGNHKVDLSCRSTRSDVGTIFTQGNYVTLKYTTDSWSPQGNGFKLIITAYKDSSLPDLKHDLKCRDFECRNTFCISSNLTCDGVNHCGDNSDETSHALCIDDMASSQILGLGGAIQLPCRPTTAPSPVTSLEAEVFTGALPNVFARSLPHILETATPQRPASHFTFPRRASTTQPQSDQTRNGSNWLV